MAAEKALGRQSPTAQRLRILREHLGCDTSAAMAGKLGISPQRWNNFEGGLPLSKEIAFKLVRLIPGLTTDWLWFGKADGLPVHLARDLEGLPEPARKGSTRS